MDKLKYICKKCDCIAFADTFQEIVDNEKTCVVCIAEEKSAIRSERARKRFLKKEAYYCNHCNHVDTKTNFSNANSARKKIVQCPKCFSIDYTIKRGDE